MILKFLTSAFLVFFLIPFSANALPEPNIVTLEDVASVEEGVAEISSTLESQGFDIVLTLDHSANAARVGLELAPTTVIFARIPSFPEQSLLRKGRTVAIDLPVKFLVYEEDDEIRLATNAVGYLSDRHNLRTRDRLLNTIDRLQDQFAAPDDGLITVPSNQSVEDTVASIEEALMSTGTFGIPLVVNYGQNQESRKHYQRRNIKSTLIVFGNPNVGTPLMQAQRSIGIDLPQKYLVWEDGKGNVNISYNDPFSLADRHSIEGQDERLTAVSGALNNFAMIGAGG